MTAVKKNMLPKLSGKHIRIRPMARGFDSDDLWLVKVVAGEETLELSNAPTGYSVVLGCDHVVEYRSDAHSDGFLVLKSQIELRGGRMHVEPILPWNQRSGGQQDVTARRRTVRSELVKFHQLIHDTDHGRWPGVTLAAWQPLQSLVLAQRREVQHLLDVDRPGAGLDWCVAVEDCLEKGWQLLHNCFGQSVLRGAAVEKVHDEMPARRESYYMAYKKVTED
jgi:hypothetical protein